ncbi:MULTISPECIES: DUF6668 family protein [unclassified Streptomyces]|uniref:DUF6668 family protein n=1 Tax=unclassified Streptomyces TaxID=2593676 RepID=UPI0033ACDDA4
MGVPPAGSAGPQMWIRGPAAQQAAPATAVSPQASGPAPSGPAEPAEEEPSPHRGERVAWVNAHGGGGASTLVGVLGGADLGRRWPEPARGEPGGVLLVARTHAGGMRAASQALNALRLGDHPDGVHLIALVLVADAPGRLPRRLGQRVRVLRSAAEVHRVPWIPAWRLGTEVDPLPKQVRALAELTSGAPRRKAGPR